jgi:type IV secretory pathway VirB4 component
MPESGASILTKIPIADIQNNAVILKDGSLRGVLMVSSVNFALKSADEQDALTFRYQQFLNSLDFPIQILIVTRRFDITEYASVLEQKKREQENELLRIQTGEYIDFVKGLTQVVNIMSTFFYIIVPYAQAEPAKAAMGFADRITRNLFSPETNQTEKQTLEQMKAGLGQRVNYIISGLGACGLKSAILEEAELKELFYKLYNPQAENRESAKQNP